MFTKSLTTALFIALVSPAASAQERSPHYRHYDADPTPKGFATKGAFLLGGSFSFSALTTTATLEDFEDEFEAERSTSIFGASILFGHFFVDNFFLGGALGVNYQSDEQDNFEVSQTTGLLDVMPRYYVQLSEARQAFFVIQGNLGYASTSSDDSEGDDRELSGFTAGLAAGLAAVLGDDEDGAVVDLMVSFRHSFLETDDEDGATVEVDINTFGFTLGIGTYF